MVYQIGNVYFYDTLTVNGTAYTENGIHKPPVGSVLDSSHLIAHCIPSFIPKNNTAFSILEVNEMYTGQYGTTQYYPENTTGPSPNYMSLAISIGGINRQFYGWIDSITSQIQGANKYKYIIRWHVDYWMTYGALAHYGSGRLLRGPVGYARPNPSEPRMWVEGVKKQLYDTTVQSNTSPWIVVYFTSKWNIYDNQTPPQIIATYTTFKLAFWQSDSTVMHNSVSYPTISDHYVYFGMTEEMMGLDPDSIVGVYISPIPPAKPTSSAVSTNAANSTLGGMHAWYETRAGYPEEMSGTFTDMIQTNDFRKYLITDANGATVATLPWGVSFDGWTATLDIGPSGAYAVFHFTSSGHSTSTGAEGRIISIPLITAPVTSNAWASYNYSGEREYDREMKQIQQEQAAVSGIANIGSSVIGGAVAGSIAPGVGTAAGALAGGASGLIGTAANYVTTGYYDYKTQQAVDRFASNQTSSVVVTSGGASWMTSVCPGCWYLLAMDRDPTSQVELAAENQTLGYITDRIVTNLTQVIAGKGGLRIENLEVYGLTPEGNRYISDMFARGVHLD